MRKRGKNEEERVKIKDLSRRRKGWLNIVKS
jgi:hypothetical protein